MRARADRRARQRNSRPPMPSCRIDNDYNPEVMPQYFQISVNVLEARKLVWSNTQAMNSYVVVVLGKKKHRTSVRRNMEEPFFRENFIFEMYVSMRDIQSSSLWLAIMEPRCCAPPRLMGETTVDLGAIWAQPHHQVYHKWAQLSLPRDHGAGPVGFVKVDISIIFRGEVQVMPAVVSNQKLEEIKHYNGFLPRFGIFEFPIFRQQTKKNEGRQICLLLKIYLQFLSHPEIMAVVTLPKYWELKYTKTRNLLLPAISEQQRANYLVTIYGAFGIPYSTQVHNEKRKLPSTYARVSFCGLVAKTSVQHRTTNPMFFEQVSIVEMFPNLNQTIKIEICSLDSCFHKVLASVELNLEQISHGGENGFLPTFGPSLIHMYGSSSGAVNTGEDDPFHRGSLLVALKMIVPYYQQGVRSISVEPATPIKIDSLWHQEEFCVICPVIEVSMLDRRVVGKICGVAITIGDIPSDTRPDEDFAEMMSILRARKFHYTGSISVMKTKPAHYGYLDFPNAFPVLQLATHLPDFRFRMYRNNMIYGIVADLELTLDDVERRLKNYDYTSPCDLMDQLNKAIDDAAGNILKFLDIVQYSHGNGEETTQMHSTELDQKQLALQKEEIQKIYQQISTRTKGSTLSLIQTLSMYTTISQVKSKKSVKLLLAETKTLANSLRDIIYKTSEGWPDIVVWLLSGGSRVAYTKISTADVIYSVIPEQCGRNCGRIQTIYMKPLKCQKHLNNTGSACFCIAGKIEVLLWMGLYRQRSVFNSFLPQGYHLKVRDYDMCVTTTAMMVESRAFIYRAKLISSPENSNLINSFVRINALNVAKDTQVKPKTSTPTWNQVIKIQRMVFTTADRLNDNPPLIMVEIYDINAALGKQELIGRFQLKPVVDDRQSYEDAPRLQWYELYKGIEYTGQILMSIQLLQIPEQFLKSTVYAPLEASFHAPDAIDLELATDAVVPLPAGLIPKSASYKVDIYWWGLRDVNITRKPCVVLELDELTVKSDIIVDKRSNCNFPNGKTTHTFECPLTEQCSPPLNIRLYDSSTFGRTLFLGTNVVKNPNKYMVNWLLKNEREATLKSASIMSSDYYQVSHGIFIRKSCKSLSEIDSVSSVSIRSSVIQNNVKRSKLRRLFSRKEPDEEEYTLLPVYVKEKDQIRVVKKCRKPDQKDWWLRFFCSQQEYALDESRGNSDYIAIYYSELEVQPEFSKFKDWCTTLKLYNGKKTGIPDKDDQLHCGYLKAGIVIYKWPPPGNTVAVSLNGVDLNRGFFDDHPDNNPAKFLVRVYIVRGLNLLAKDSTGKSDPYVVLHCGKKHLGDRSSFIPNSLEPVFGKMYEFRCTLPEEYLLTVSLYDYDDMTPQDELIGSTAIDLEDRVYTKHRARVGISTEFNSSGPTKWRDTVKPSVILEELCYKNHLLPPIFPDPTTVIVNGVQYKDSRQDKIDVSPAVRKENICLSILHRWHTLPICGYHLVPEHVETRSLINPENPGHEQGKIQLWVDIYPLDGTSTIIPLPADISPRKIEEYELRVIIWDVQNLELDSFEHAGKVWKSANVYVKAWIGSLDKAMCTDLHHNSVGGEANFNWRMIFRFLYQHAERKIVNKEKGPFIEHEEYVTPCLIVQLLEIDADDFFGSISLNLNQMPRGSKLACHCTLDGMERAKKINLFALTSIRAWWPLKTIDMNTGRDLPAGVIDMELTLLPIEKAMIMPVGVGRYPPCPLPLPRRPKNYMDVIKCLSIGHCSRFTIAIIFIWITVILLMSLYVDLPGTFGWFRFSHYQHQKHAEGIIRTLYPVKT